VSSEAEMPRESKESSHEVQTGSWTDWKLGTVRGETVRKNGGKVHSRGRRKRSLMKEVTPGRKVWWDERHRGREARAESSLREARAEEMKRRSEGVHRRTRVQAEMPSSCGRERD